MAERIGDACSLDMGADIRRELARRAADRKLDVALEADDYVDSTEVYRNPETRVRAYENSQTLKGFPVKGSLSLNGSNEAARTGLNARNTFDRVQDRVTHRPPAGGVKQGS